MAYLTLAYTAINKNLVRNGLYLRVENFHRIHVVIPQKMTRLIMKLLSFSEHELDVKSNNPVTSLNL